MIADGQGRDAFSEGGNDSGALMAHNQGKRNIPLAAQDVKVGVAHSRGGNLDRYFTRTRGGKLDVGNVDIRSVENDGFHARPLVRLTLMRARKSRDRLVALIDTFAGFVL